jgi:hypothetical protein
MKNHILVITTWERQEYAGFEAHEYWQSESGKSWDYKKYADNKRGMYTPPTVGIKLYAQCNLFPTSEDNRHMYAMDVSIDNSVNMRELEQARANISRLTKIEKKYIELCKKFGYPETFAQFASYIAEVTGAELAEYSNIAGDYVSMDVSQIAYKERKITRQDK